MDLNKISNFFKSITERLLITLTHASSRWRQIQRGCKEYSRLHRPNFAWTFYSNISGWTFKAEYL